MRRIWRAFLYSISGLKEIIKTERAFRQESAVFSILIPIAVFLNISPLLKLFLVSSHLIVLVAELLNSSIEATVNITSPEFNPLARNAKNYGSAAVMLSIVNLLIIWIVVLLMIF